MLERLLSLSGLVLFIAAGWLLSDNRRSVNWRLVLWGLALQFLFAVMILKTEAGLMVFDAARVVMESVLEFSDNGARFLFGNLVSDMSIGAIFAFKVLPVIIFVSSIMGILTYLNVIQIIVRFMAKIMQRSMKASGAEALMAAMFVFMGIEATTAIKDYIRGLTRSELFTIMTGFMATIAGSVMAVYVSFGASAGHLLAASVMSAPAAIVLSKLIVPETEKPLTSASSIPAIKSADSNVFEAAANGAYDGMKLAATIAAMLLAFIAIIGMLNHFLGYAHTSFETVMGYAFTPVAFLMGVPWADCPRVGELIGIKIVLNDFLAYQKMGAYIRAGVLGPRAITIATYALCSFANFANIAVLIGGIGAIAPDRKKEVASLALKAVIAGAVASFMTATIAGVLV